MARSSAIPATSLFHNELIYAREAYGISAADILFSQEAAVITPPLAYSRYFYKEDEVILSVCNYCFAVVAESGDERELDLREQQHACVEQTRAFAA